MARVGRLLLALTSALVLVLVLAPNASAHAALVASDPANTSTVSESPGRITLTFDESVEAELGGVRLYDSAQKQLPVGRATRASGRTDQITVTVPGLDRGTYLVVWRVSSADGHPVQGAYTFSVKSTSAPPSADFLASTLASTRSSTSLATVRAVDRAVGFASTALLLGVPLFALLAWPEGLRRRSVSRVLAGSWLLSLLTAVLAIGVLGATTVGGGVGEIFDSSLWSPVLDTGVGSALGLRVLVLLVAAIPLVAMVGPWSSARWWKVVGAGLASVLALSFGLAGHPRTGSVPAVAVLADSLHVLAMSAWLGGLAFASVLALRVAPDPDLVARRLSKLALVSVVVLVVTGVSQTVLQVDSWNGLVHSTYGRWLAIKLALVAVMVALGARSRVQLAASGPMRFAAAGSMSDTASVPVIRRRVLLESGVGMAVLVVTSMLVNTPPAKVASSVPLSFSLVQAQVILDATLTPARQGPNELHLLFTPPGGSIDPVTNVRVRLTPADGRMGPLAVPVEPAGPNHYITPTFDVPFDGRWQLEVLVERNGTVRFAKQIVVR